jgi:hypothetical protein
VNRRKLRILAENMERNYLNDGGSYSGDSWPPFKIGWKFGDSPRPMVNFKTKLGP